VVKVRNSSGERFRVIWRGVGSIPTRRKTLATGPTIPTGRYRTARNGCATKCRDGAEKSCFVCQTTRGSCSATLIDYSSRRDFGRRESRPACDSRRGFEKDRRTAKTLPCATGFCSREIAARNEVGRGVGQGYFACHAGDVGSTPTRSATFGSSVAQSA